MNCPNCGTPIPDQEEGQNPMPHTCPSCGSHLEPPPKQRGKLGWVLGAVLAVAVVCGAAVVLLPKGPAVTAQQHRNPTSLVYSTSREMGIFQGDQATSLFDNTALDLGSFSSIKQTFAMATPYVGRQNFVQLDNGDRVIAHSTLSRVDGYGQPVTTVSLRLCKPDGEVQVLDQGVQGIYCANGSQVFYNKLEEDGSLRQYCYQDGTILPSDEITGLSNSIVADLSEDGSLMAVLQLDENAQIVSTGYLTGGQYHAMPDGESVYYISRDGKTVYTVLPQEDRLTTLSYVTDLSTGATEKIGEGVSDMIPYAEDGSLVFIQKSDLSQGDPNPAGTLSYFDAASRTTTQVADNATAIVEAFPAAGGWFNENARSLQPTELATNHPAVETPAHRGSFLYFDKAGSLMAVGLDGATQLLGEGLYNPQSYALHPDVYLLNHIGEEISWCKGDSLHRYRLGSLESPRSYPLESSLADKLESSAQMGCLTVGSGDILEENGDTVLLKSLSTGETTTVLEGVGSVRLVGLDNDGERFYFLTQDQSLYAKELGAMGNPKRIASNVQSAVVTTDGVYTLVDYDQSQGGTLQFLAYGKSSPAVLAQGVQRISATTVG